MKIDIRGVTYESVLSVCSNMREMDRKEVFANCRSDDPVELADNVMAISGVKWSGFVDGKAVSVHGAWQVWPGVWSVYAFGTDGFGGIARALTRHIRRVMLPAAILAKAHRAHCFSLAEHVEAHRWLERLGATREATLRRYGKNGEDFVVFSWVWEAGDVHGGWRRWRGRWRGGGSRAPGEDPDGYA